jgi:hypothetical protein
MIILKIEGLITKQNFNSFVSFILKQTFMSPQYVISVQNALQSILTIRGLLDLTFVTYGMPQCQFHSIDMTSKYSFAWECINLLCMIFSIAEGN